MGASSEAGLEALDQGSVKALNPYWDQDGKTFGDPDGYRVVLQRASWRLQLWIANWR